MLSPEILRMAFGSLGLNKLRSGLTILGLTLLFLLLSLMATAIREAIESILKTRAVYLERGIREMLGDRNGVGIAKDFYEHPLISSLFRGEFDNKSSRKQGGALPTYIPAKTFAKALMDLAYRGPISQNAAATPVFVKGAMPGDILEIEFTDIIPQPTGFTAIMPGLGFLYT